MCSAQRETRFPERGLVGGHPAWRRVCAFQDLRMIPEFWTTPWHCLACRTREVGLGVRRKLDGAAAVGDAPCAVRACQGFVVSDCAARDCIVE